MDGYKQIKGKREKANRLNNARVGSPSESNCHQKRIFVVAVVVVVVEYSGRKRAIVEALDNSNYTTPKANEWKLWEPRSV